MVRLKDEDGEWACKGAIFQFHYGTIKRQNNGLVEFHDVKFFNSTMVRLKEIMNAYPNINIEFSIPLWYD